jgi:hypothetical protein
VPQFFNLKKIAGPIYIVYHIEAPCLGRIGPESITCLWSRDNCPGRSSHGTSPWPNCSIVQFGHLSARTRNYGYDGDNVPSQAELSNVPNNYGQMESSPDDSDSIEKSLVADGGTVAVIYPPPHDMMPDGIFVRYLSTSLGESDRRNTRPQGSIMVPQPTPCLVALKDAFRPLAPPLVRTVSIDSADEMKSCDFLCSGHWPSPPAALHPRW